MGALKMFYAVFNTKGMAHRTASKDILSALAKHGAKTASLNIYDDHWQAAFDFEKAAIVDLHLLTTEYDRSMVSSGHLERLTVDLTDPQLDDEVDLIIVIVVLAVISLLAHVHVIHIPFF